MAAMEARASAVQRAFPFGEPIGNRRTMQMVAANPLFRHHLDGLAMVLATQFGLPINTFQVRVGQMVFTWSDGEPTRAQPVGTPRMLSSQRPAGPVRR